jgi:hypothetical protein
MFPDTGRLSIPLIPIGPSGSVGSLSSVVQDPAMQTLVAGLQYMFRQQIGSILGRQEEDRQDGNRFGAELKSLIAPSSLVMPADSPQVSPSRLPDHSSSNLSSSRCG